MSERLPDPNPTVEMKFGIAGQPVGIPPNNACDRCNQESTFSFAKPGGNEDWYAVEGKNPDLVAGREVERSDGEHGGNHLPKNPTAGLLNKDFRQTHGG